MCHTCVLLYSDPCAHLMCASLLCNPNPLPSTMGFGGCYFKSRLPFCVCIFYQILATVKIECLCSFSLWTWPTPFFLVQDELNLTSITQNTIYPKEIIIIKLTKTLICQLSTITSVLPDVNPCFESLLLNLCMHISVAAKSRCHLILMFTLCSVSACSVLSSLPKLV